jgi:hypothetical protein
VNAEKVVTLEISGKIVEILEVKSGKSANGEWRKQEYVMGTLQKSRVSIQSPMYYAPSPKIKIFSITIFCF